MAGLLDGLFDPSLFGGGLLSRLSPMVGGIPQSNGFPGQASPIGIGGYQMPRMGDAAQFTPPPQDPAALPVNAQPAQGQLPPQQPNFLQALSENFQNMGNGGSLIGALTGQRPNNQTAQFLVSKGIDPAMAQTIVSDPGLLRSVLPSLLGTGGQTDDIKEYQFAKREDPSLTFSKFMQQKKSVSGEYSLTPQYGTNAKGETVLIQTGKSGEAIQTKLPEGVKISSGVDKVDLGTQWGIIDKRTGQMVGTQPKDLQGKEAAEERGKQQGQAQAKIPAALIDAEETTKKIDDLLKNDGLDSIVGSLDQYRPSWALGDSGRKALSQLEQLQGGAFLQAFNTLKGGGAITEIEGQKAERAIARMQRYQSEKDFREALMDFRDAVKTGVRKLQAAAGSSAAPQATAAPAPSGLPTGWSVKVN